MPFILEFVKEEELVSIPESDIFTWGIIRTRPGRGRRPRSGEEENFVEEMKIVECVEKGEEGVEVCYGD